MVGQSGVGKLNMPRFDTWKSSIPAPAVLFSFLCTHRDLYLLMPWLTRTNSVVCLAIKG